MRNRIILLGSLLAMLIGSLFWARRRGDQPTSNGASPALDTEALREQLRDSQDRLSSEIGLISKSGEQMRAQVVRIDVQLERVGDQLDRLNSDLAQTRTQAAELDELKSSMISIAGQLNSRQRQTQSVIDGLKDQHNQLQSQTGTLEGASASLQTTADELQQQYQGLASAHGNLEHTLAALMQDRNDVSEQKEQLHRLIETLQQQVKGLGEIEELLTQHALTVSEYGNRYESDRQLLLDGLRRLADMAALYETTREELGEEVNDGRSTISRLEGKLAALENRIEAEQQAHAQTKSELARRDAELNAAREQLQQSAAANAHLEARLESILSSADSETSDASNQWYLRETPKSFEELVIAVREEFPATIALPETAVLTTDRLRSMANADQLAGDTWRAMIAMHEYASLSPRYSGNFYEWCRDSGHPRVFPAGNVAMNESDTTKHARNRSGYSREFYVDQSVSRTGKVNMYAHLKLGSIGQNQPRLYFHDDTGGQTGKVHIGFLGPHNEVKNASSS